jgi:hypothetical protein
MSMRTIDSSESNLDLELARRIDQIVDSAA